MTDEHQRPEPPRGANELDTLTGFLDFLRATIAWKCQGLDDDHLRQTLAPSSMTLGGMLTHLAFVEDYWCGYVMMGRGPREPFATADWEGDEDFDWHLAPSMPADQIHQFWASAVTDSRAIVDELAARPEGLDTVQANPDAEQPATLRWVLVHLIEEYARHAGHADLIRQSVDGLVGE